MFVSIRQCFHSTEGISSVQSLSCVRLFVTAWPTARQASLSITNAQSLLKFMSIESVMPNALLLMAHMLFIGTRASLSIHLLTDI